MYKCNYSLCNSPLPHLLQLAILSCNTDSRQWTSSSVDAILKFGNLAFGTIWKTMSWTSDSIVVQYSVHTVVSFGAKLSISIDLVLSLAVFLYFFVAGWWTFEV